MNTYASKNSYTLYKNPGSEKRDPYQALPKKVYKNFETIKRANKGIIVSDNSSVDSIIKFFRGTIVTADIGIMELKAKELFN